MGSLVGCPRALRKVWSHLKIHGGQRLGPRILFGCNMTSSLGYIVVLSVDVNGERGILVGSKVM